MSKVCAYYHIVLNTKRRRATIPMDSRRRLYAYMHGIITNHNCKTIRINGIENHVHLLIELHPSVALADLVGDIKRSSTLWMRSQPEFKAFECWGKEYFASTVSYNVVPKVKEYIINQEAHHKGTDFEDEIRMWVERYGMEWGDYLLS